MKGKSSKSEPPQGRRATMRGTKSLGRVLDLEEHVQPDWWRRIFNSMYLKTDGDVMDDQDITRKEIDLFFRTLRPSPEEGILDLCCGQGRHCLELTRRGFQSVEGLDRSHYLIQKARAQAKEEELNVRFREGDARKLPYLPDSFDVVMILGNSFGYFETIQDNMRVLKEVFRVLKPWGRLLIDVADGEYLAGTLSKEMLGMDRQKAFCLSGAFPFIGQTVSNLTRSGYPCGERYYYRSILC